MDSLTIAASGLRSAELRMAASARNVANLNTPAFRPLRTHQVSLAGGGSAAQVTQEARPQEVDLAREFLEQIRAGFQYKASLRTYAAAAEMRGHLLDILA